jgi:hypothetical protein
MNLLPLPQRIVPRYPACGIDPQAISYKREVFLPPPLADSLHRPGQTLNIRPFSERRVARLYLSILAARQFSTPGVDPSRK